MNKLQGPSTAAAVERGRLYTECWKNHGARWGEYARDGCQEFVPSGTELDQALECAVCGCHRNFHRKTISKDDHHRNINVQYQSCCKNHGARIGKYSTDSCKEFLASESDPLKCEVCGCHRNFHRISTSSSGTTSSANPEVSDGQYVYGECFKNHGASAGEYSKDGCKEFVGSERSGGALCDACGCHRNFHRRDQVVEDEMNLNAQYGDCCKNYGAWNGDYMRDGCEEFVGRERHGVSYNYVLACDACGCHRSFHRKKVRNDDGGGGGSRGGNSCNSVKYGKCCKNHGAYDVVYRTDGCKEFVGGERSVVRCKSCGCHRNFHRKIVVEDDDDGSGAAGFSD